MREIRNPRMELRERYRQLDEELAARYRQQHDREPWWEAVSGRVLEWALVCVVIAVLVLFIVAVIRWDAQPILSETAAAVAAYHKAIDDVERK
jgi:hypothetical protein